MTHLRKRMLEELQRRNYSEGTTRAYLHAVEQFAVHFGKSPDKLGPDDLRSYQAYLLVERKLAVGSVVARVAALRFFFVRTLKRRDFREELPYPKSHRRLPTVLSLEEVARLIDAAGNLMQRALRMTLYGTGMRRTEVSMLKVHDIDSRRMMIRVERGKGGASRDLPLSPALLETLREYWRWKKPKIYLFPSSMDKKRDGLICAIFFRKARESGRQSKLRCLRMKNPADQAVPLQSSFSPLPAKIRGMNLSTLEARVADCFAAAIW